MNLQELFMDLKQVPSQYFTSLCIVNGIIMDLNKIEQMGCRDFWIMSKSIMPIKLYKYFPDLIKELPDGRKVNYSIQALEDNTVFMQSPNEFDDIYDSDVHIEFSDYERFRLIEYCHRCGIDADKTITAQDAGNLLLKRLFDAGYSVEGFLKVFKLTESNRIIRLSNELFCKRLYIQLLEKADFGQALAEVIRIEYDKYCSDLRNRFRVSCFATSPYSQLMWGGAYANCHNGFCLEYTVIPKDEKYIDIYHNLFPMIYCKTRPNMSERIVEAKDRETTQEELWDIYFHGVLRKSIDWAYQNEWRLLLPMNMKTDYNIKFFQITKVFMGNRMSADRCRDIIDICNRKNVPYVKMERAPDIFEMRECEV